MEALDQQLLSVLPYRVGNVVEYIREGHNVYGKVEEVNMNLRHDSTGKRVTRVAFRVNEALVDINDMVRKVSDL